MRTNLCATALAVSLLVATLITTTRADEGMWLFNNPPRKLLKIYYQLDLPDTWLEHVQKSSVRLSTGGSGSFVSADGLVLTNHHVGIDCLQKLSTRDRDYVQTGFYARTRAEEVKCHDLELNVLMGIEDVTDKVRAAIKPNMDAAEADRARRAALSAIEKEVADRTGLRCETVPFYQGAQYHLYRYKKYTDVRLVFAPEEDIATFGGDPDNFEYPRYDLDLCLFRAYENDKPAQVEHFLKWSEAGAKENDLVFVSGHPGKTSRLNTVYNLKYLRDFSLPLTLKMLRRQEVCLKAYRERSAECTRRSEDEYLGVQNNRKRFGGMLNGLQDPALIARKMADENALKEAINKDPELKKAYGEAWDRLANLLHEGEGAYLKYFLFEQRGRNLTSGRAFNSKLFGIARTLVRLVAETKKPNGERLREYRESNLESLKQQLFSPAPIYEDLEAAKLADSLGMLAEEAGGEDEVVLLALAGKSPKQRAAELVYGTKLKDVSARQKLAEGGLQAIKQSDDPMIKLAMAVDEIARKVRKEYEETVDEPQASANVRITNAILAVRGPDIYPDATFTLRLSYGLVKGYDENGHPVPWYTNMGNLFEYAEAHKNEEAFKLPKRWLERKDKIKKDTPFNFVCTADIIGGSSGSPVLNREGELVGLIFDGNVQSLVSDYVYTEEQARAVAVHSQGILEALRKVYDAGPLADELTKKK
jgi:hypothetical protein